MQTATRILVISLLAAGAAGAGPDRPDTLLHVVRPGDNLIGICGEYRDVTGHYTLTEMLGDVRRANRGDAEVLRIGQRLRIPVRPADSPPRVAARVADGAEFRGIYLAGPACAAASVFTRVDRFVAAGGNAVVFDAKDIDGAVTYRSAHPLASWGAGRSAPLLPGLTELTGRLQKRDLYVVARLALFLDGELGRRRPDLALQNEQGEPWAERGCVWVDPARPEVRDYNLALAVELAEAGVDEIQFDYVRFPTNGWRGDHGEDTAATALRRREVIAGFLAEARSRLASRGVRISADLYGIMAWDRMADLALTGQHVPTIAAHVDVICPMIYPSHFGPGFEGHARPGDAPAHFVGEGTRRFRELAGEGTRIRPWLQAFPYRVSRFDAEYVAVQVEAARAAGGDGWCLWNPSCSYAVALTAMPDLIVPAPGAASPTSVAVTSPAPTPPAPAPPDRAQPTAGSARPVVFLGSMVPIRSGGLQAP